MMIAAPEIQRRVLMEGVSWSLYQQMLAESAESHLRMTYDRGRLEIMSPLPRHENVKKILSRLIETYADIKQIKVEGLGSTTFAREDLQRGLEPDECYYIANASAIIGKDEFDLTVDPPPDLAIEIDISPPDVAKQPIYAALGVGEIWRFDGRAVSMFRRVDQSYVLISSSDSLPEITVQWVNELLSIGMLKGQSAAVSSLREKLE